MNAAVTAADRGRVQAVTRAAARAGGAQAAAFAGRPWDRLARLRRQRRIQTAAIAFMVVLGPVLALATYGVMGPLSERTASRGLRLILLADLIYILLLVGLVIVFAYNGDQVIAGIDLGVIGWIGWRRWREWSARRAGPVEPGPVETAPVEPGRADARRIEPGSVERRPDAE